MSETKVPAIPSTSSDKFPDAIKELIEVREGIRGDPLDQNVTLRQLADAKVISATTTSSGGSGKRPGVTFSPFGGAPILTVPPAITGLVVTGGYQQMFLEWGQPAYLNRSYVEIWRSDVDELGGAIQIGQTPSMVFSDACGSGKTFYYWVRAVSDAGVTGPFNTVHGTVGSTAEDVEFLLTALTGNLTSSQLHSDLGSRIDLIDNDALVNSVGARIAGLRGDLEGEISIVATDVVNVQQDMITRLDAIVLENATGDAALVLTESTARIAADGVLSQQITDVAAIANGNTAALELEYTARANGDSASTTIAQSAASRVGDVESSLQNNYYTRSGTDTAIASATTTLSSTVNGHTASINVLTTVTNGISGQYTVKIDTGRVVGFGLYGGATSGSFEVRADKFVISAPANTYPSSTNPFFVLTTPESLFVGGAYVTAQPGTYINTAFIIDATITEAKIGVLSADKITVGNIAADRMKVNVITATNLSADLINAVRIDTRGLNVKDANGNILMSSTSHLPTFAQYYKWDFQSTYDGWDIQNGATLTYGTDSVSADFTGATGSTALLVGPTITAFVGSKNPLVRMRMKVVSGSMNGWLGYLRFIREGSTTLFPGAGVPTPIGNDWVELEWNLTEVSEWVNHGVTQLQFDLIDTSASKPVLLIDWIAIGGTKTGNIISGANISTFIQAGTITDAYIGNYIASTGFNGDVYNLGTDPGTAGWAINKDGNAVFQNGYFRGDIRANSVSAGVLDGTTIAGVTITGATVNAGTLNTGYINVGSTGLVFRDSYNGIPVTSTVVRGFQEDSTAERSGALVDIFSLSATADGGPLRQGSIPYTVTVSAEVDIDLMLYVDGLHRVTGTSPGDDYGPAVVTFAGTHTSGTGTPLTVKVKTSNSSGKTRIRNISASIMCVNF